MSWRTITARADESRPNRQVAVIDLGSNSWRLVVFSYVPGAWWKRTDELHETVRIGQGLGESGALGDAAMERGLETIEVFGRYCAAHGIAAGSVHAVATSAIRDAANGEEFLARARERSGLDIEVLSAVEEGRYGYIAAVNTTTLTDGGVVELGGGSLQLVEVAAAGPRRSTRSRSAPCGSPRGSSPAGARRSARSSSGCAATSGRRPAS